MLRLLFFLILVAGACVPVYGQYRVKLEVSATETELENAFRDSLTAEIGKISDIQLRDKGDFGLLVQLIRRPDSGDEDDIFVSAIATASSVCILEQEASGKVVSRQPCREFLTSNTYIGRAGETRRLASEIISSFNGYVLMPLREIGLQ